MDPVTQGAFGAIFAQTFSNKKKILFGSIVGCFAGLAPDLDILIRSASDPLLKLEYHRQFTHSLIFIPIGALIVTLFSRIIFKKYLSWGETYLFSFLGFATHGLLDACTSYGTQLLWPFTDERISWNYISVVDPFLTIPVILAIIFAIIMKNKYITLFGIVYILAYLTFGAYQENRAQFVGKSIANLRGHDIKDLTAKPSLGNLFLWKTIYEDDGFYYVDAARLFTKSEYCQGTKIKKLDLNNDFLELDVNSQQYKDVKRFDWFSQGYLGKVIEKKIITDVRYSAVPNEVDGLWGIKINLDKNNSSHVDWVVNRSNYMEKWKRFFDLILGKNCKSLIN
ncbi:MAG: metal-dependent hydrolase [Gammaproteobacteria bacterium]|nr:metal-dependent hydrolase [Gammaproteobacteria bacterium]